MKESKFLIVGILITLLIFGGGVYFMTREKSSEVTNAFENPTEISASPELIELGDVSINSGIVTRDFEIKNESPNSIRVSRIATSCMCTKASIVIDGKESKQYSMETPGDKNALINVEIPANGTAQIKFFFDPAAHGLKGIGAFDRTVFVTFADSRGVKQLKFKGVVVSS